MTLDELKAAGEAPEWLTEDSLGNLPILENETPKQAYTRLSSTAAKHLKAPELEAEFFLILWNNWLCPATPVFSNFGTDRGLPISCFGEYIEDSMSGIGEEIVETMILSKNGGGTSAYAGAIRERGSLIKGGANGKSEGKIPFMKQADSTILASNQGGVRRGAKAMYDEVWSGDFDEFLRMRRPLGDVNRQCLNLHHGFCIGDDFMKAMQDGDLEARRRWSEILKTRWETGEPYMFFKDNVNRANPPEYAKHNLTVYASNLCTEIMLASNKDYTFVCCLSSLNAARFPEWQNWVSPSGKSLPYLSTFFLDSIITEFIEKAKAIDKTSRFPWMGKAIAFAEDSRALGLGVLGFHTLLQKDMSAFDSLRAKMFNSILFKKMDEESRQASKDLAILFGEPKIMIGSGYRNSHRIALAPTVSNALNSGNVSPSIEAWSSNLFVMGSAKQGNIIRKNAELEKLLIEKEENTLENWNSISSNGGSVQHLNFLSKEEKEVFQTAREINQFAVLKLAADRQKYIDQGQSTNLFFDLPPDKDKFPVEHKKWVRTFHRLHEYAWESGLKSLYYCRGKSSLKGDTASKETERASLKFVKQNDESVCSACEG